jgi:hypothetical protein
LLPGSLLLVCLATAALFAADERPLPEVFSLSIKDLAAVRERLARHDPALEPALARLRAEADKLLKQTPGSVMDKTRVPPSGDKHDYLSLAPYFWPNPKTADGLPYVRRDGEINPESKSGTDANTFAAMGEAIGTLGLAYFFTGHEPYAEKAAAFARTWFLDPATRMNPQLNYAQAVRGKNDGRGTGILDSRHLVVATDGLALLAGSPAWKAEDKKALLAWLDAYNRWVTESKNGQDERAAKNNHGSWYDAQIVHYALVLGHKDDARKIAQAALKDRIAAQIEPDGRQPLEIERTKSFDYCCFNLEALLQLARASANAGVDLWNFTTPDGRSLQGALRFLAPYADPAKTWIKQDLVSDSRTRLLPFLAEALNHREDPLLRAAFKKFATEESRTDRWRLLYNTR